MIKLESVRTIVALTNKWFETKILSYTTTMAKTLTDKSPMEYPEFHTKALVATFHT